MKIICVQNYGSSGTSLLHSLIDNHHSVLCLPGLTGIQYYSMWRGAILNNPVKNLTMGSLLSFISWWFRPLYDPSEIDVGLGLDSLGPDHNEHPCVDRTVFHDHFRAIRNRLLKEAGVPMDVYDASRHQVYRRCLLQAVYMAYEAARGRNAEVMTCMLFPSHSCAPEDIADLVQDFPDHRFVYMIRHPAAVYNSAVKSVSLLARQSPGTIDVFHTCINQVLLDEAPQVHGYGARVYSLYRYPTVRSDSCAAIRLEDLHKNGQATMAKLTQWLGITWSDTLMESTFAGKIWWNRPMSKRVNGFDKSMVDNIHLENATELDVSRINFLLSDIYKKYGYENEEGSRKDFGMSFFKLYALPFKCESLWFSFSEENSGTSKCLVRYYFKMLLSYLMCRVSMLRSLMFIRRNQCYLVNLL